jgi:hypothetical protein
MANPNATGKKKKDSIAISGAALSPYFIVDDGNIYKIFKNNSKSVVSYPKSFEDALMYIARKKHVSENSGTIFEPLEYIESLDSRLQDLLKKYGRFGR